MRGVEVACRSFECENRAVIYTCSGLPLSSSDHVNIVKVSSLEFWWRAWRRRHVENTAMALIARVRRRVAGLDTPPWLSCADVHGPVPPYGWVY